MKVWTVKKLVFQNSKVASVLPKTYPNTAGVRFHKRVISTLLQFTAAQLLTVFSFLLEPRRVCLSRLKRLNFAN